MRAVLTGFAGIWLVTLAGYLAGRLGILGPDATALLARLVFYLAAPALLFSTLATSSLDKVFTPALAVFVLSTVVAAGLYVGLSLRARPAPEVTIGALCASYVNAGNLGLPIAAYVLGDASLIVPVLLFQLLVATPTALAVLDVTAAGHRPAPLRLLSAPLRNPISVACLCGLLVAASGWRLPPEVLRPFELVGGAAVPLALLALGLALRGSRPFAGGPDAGQRYLAVALKVVVQPTVAWAIGRFVFGLDGHALLSAVVLSALPSAQNLFVYATRYGRATGLARDAIVLSTLAAVPVLIVVAALLT
ncbi:AEC family transporter [Asanoa siamensis]|uniref:Membrane protein n=1 Tax=Asanoa siamensis TaxID=926357 RepID=A0ABQ4CKT4_9ACTN|nr:AEC family transporter [Asanoa siamensis]GIF71893.1 membrane protein [Asanoa siamensis]